MKNEKKAFNCYSKDDSLINIEIAFIPILPLSILYKFTIMKMSNSDS